ncbi:unnamed protein product [Anisakis simplex]|uniref:Kinesin-like protein vab-8 (inferred by orthology to a C. elegans protein) n=1 Tax=Anisakis simplex TaxID=6269 RepID=A0A0M3KDF5_ANISI|nr:unnamed protein product [Anisakis simplex]
MRISDEVIGKEQDGFQIFILAYKTDSSQVIGGRSRLCLIDLGLGERSSKGDMQTLTMPVITNLLVALFQGQRHLPSRQSALCMLLKDSLGNVRSKNSVLFASLSDRISETENIVQMMSKIQRAARPRKSNRHTVSIPVALYFDDYCEVIMTVAHVKIQFALIIVLPLKRFAEERFTVFEG